MRKLGFRKLNLRRRLRKKKTNGPAPTGDKSKVKVMLLGTRICRSFLSHSIVAHGQLNTGLGSEIAEIGGASSSQIKLYCDRALDSSSDVTHKLRQFSTPRPCIQMAMVSA